MTTILKFLKRFVWAAVQRENVKRAFRGFLVTFATLFLPGLLGWLNAITQWAHSAGTTPFPDAHGLGYLAVSALVAATVGVVNLLWNATETASGKAVLRYVPPTKVTDKMVELRRRF